MTRQNLALDWLLAVKGGVCVLFGDQCCTYIPNNTAPDGAFTIAMAKLKNLREETAKNAGKDDGIWDWLDFGWGSWTAWFTRIGIIMGIGFVVGGFLLCCVFPVLRSLIVKATVRRMGVMRGHPGNPEDIEKVRYSDEDQQSSDESASSSEGDESDDCDI
ncbi:MAG: hypothetical protein ACRC0X_07545 [Brevinema sp.]